MSVVAPFTRHYPFLLESDILSLSSGFAVKNGALYDTALKARHSLHEPADQIVLALIRGNTYAALLQNAQNLQITDRQLTDLLGFLNMIGALQCRRTLVQRVQAASIRALHILLGVSYTPLSWRRVATLSTVIVGVWRATRPILVATLLVCAMASGAGLLATNLIFSLGTFGVLVFFGSLCIHEHIHVAIARRHSPDPQLLQTGLRLGILHRRLPARLEARSALAGPVAGSSFSLLAALLPLTTGWRVHAALGVIIGLFHTLSLLPWYGDGASLYRALNGERK